MLTPRQMWACALLLPPIAFLSLSIAVWPAPRALQGWANLILIFSPFTVSPIAAAVPYSVYCVVTGISRRQSGELAPHLSKALACAVFTVLTIIAFKSAFSLRHQAFVEASHIGDNIVQALRQYRDDHGRYPDHLDQLVPEFIEEIPYTGMIGYPRFGYQKDYQWLRPQPGEYELSIACPLGLFNWDIFIYCPSEVYPDHIWGNPLERIGRWAYMHE